jgi:hypothetical protein
MKNSNIACLVLLLTAIGVAQGQTSSPSNAPGAFVDLDGGRLYYEECGNGGDTVVLLHDGVANSAVWDESNLATQSLLCEHTANQATEQLFVTERVQWRYASGTQRGNEHGR